jgi:hypothetical protein
MIVIPMAGLSSRFTAAGYARPKYMLEAHGRSLFDQAVLSFARYFADLPFLFIARDVAGTSDFIAQRCEALGIADWRRVMLIEPTRGQAETVSLGIEAAGLDGQQPLTIFNIDTFRPGFRFQQWGDGEVDGYLETFEGEGSNWSFVRPVTPGSDRAAETSEKRPISRFCCTGMYHFSRAAHFRDAFEAQRSLGADRLEAGELYVAPLYNALIDAGRDVRFTVIPREDVVFCGVPAEYDAVKEASPLY